MKITYANSRVEKYFADFNKLKKRLPAEWVRTLKKHLNYFEIVDCFGEYLNLGLGRPERLTGYTRIRYSIRISGNVRLIVELNATQDTVRICEEIEIQGVSDYHGDKEDWYIP